MAGIRADIKGFKELADRIKKASANFPKLVDAELQLAAGQMREGALKDAPGDTGFIRKELQIVKTEPLKWGFFSNANYSGYQEFGTKSKVQIPPGLEDVAAQLRGGQGGSVEAKEAIFAWCKRKGIAKELWWPIFIKIMTTGIKPHPYFFKQLDAVRPELLKNLERVLNKI